MKRLLRPLFAASLFASVVLAAPLDDPLRAHGGLEVWRTFGRLEFDLAWKFGAKALDDHQLFDLVSRDGRVQCERYAVGGSMAGDVWVMPEEKALGGTPARFYLWTPFYFFALPFVLADDGVKSEALGVRDFSGKQYDVVRCSFGAGIGDAPGDTYTCYFDRGTHRLKLARYLVTYFDKSAGAKKDAPAEHAIVFDEWQDVQGLVVPRRAVFFNWSGDGVTGEARGSADFTNVRFAKDRPSGQTFEKPASAVLAAPAPH